MKVAVLVENACSFVAEEVGALRQAGLDVRVAAVFRPDPAPRWEAAYGGPVLYPGRGRAAWLRSAWQDLRVHPARLLPILRRAAREGAPGRLVLLAAHLAQRARVEGWQHLHGSFATFPAWTAWAAARLAGLPFSFTGHAYDVQLPRPWLPRLVAEAAFVRAISRETSARLRAAAGEEAAQRIRVSHLGVDVDCFAPAAEPEADPPEIVCVARLVAKKGIPDLLEAAAQLAARRQRFRVRLLGGGPLEPLLRRRVRALGLRDHVQFEGEVGRQQVAHALGRAALFVLPCVTVDGGRCHDGLPVALLEAMAAARPVVTTAVGGIGEAVAHGRTGWLVPPGRPDALAGALAALLDDPARRRALGTRARREVERRFRLDAAAARLARWMAET